VSPLRPDILAIRRAPLVAALTELAGWCRKTTKAISRGRLVVWRERRLIVVEWLGGLTGSRVRRFLWAARNDGGGSAARAWVSTTHVSTAVSECSRAQQAADCCSAAHAANWSTINRRPNDLLSSRWTVPITDHYPGSFRRRFPRILRTFQLLKVVFCLVYFSHFYLFCFPLFYRLIPFNRVLILTVFVNCWHDKIIQTTTPLCSRTLYCSVKTVNKMQSETADFAPGAATWRTERILRVVFDFDPFAPLCRTLRHPQNRKYITYCTILRREPSHGQR